MAELDAGSVEGALESAFAGNPVPEKASAPPPAEVVTPEQEEADAVALVEGDSDPVPLTEAELELEVEIDGAHELIRGNDRVKELVQKGLKAGRTFEENARVREALAAHVSNVQAQTAFQQAVFQDVTQLQALDAQLEQYNKIDWNAAFDADAFNALKLKEQRDTLREHRANMLGQLNFKQQQFLAHQNEGNQRVLAAESQALLAKLPEWRNSEKASTEQKAINSWLQSAGFNQGEIDGLMDHRAVLVARKAYLWDQLQAGKAAAVKKVSTAPQLSKPGVANAQPNSRTDFAKARAKLKEFGTKGNHKAQENLATAMFEKAFK